MKKRPPDLSEMWMGDGKGGAVPIKQELWETKTEEEEFPDRLWDTEPESMRELVERMNLTHIYGDMLDELEKMKGKRKVEGVNG